jgi:hypothetical protein
VLRGFSCLLILLLLPFLASADWYFVAPEGSDKADGKSPETARKTINKTLALMYPGDSLFLLPGDYHQTISTQQSGSKDMPIRVIGSQQAIVRGGTRHLVLEINHSFTEFRGFSVNGKKDDGSQLDHYKSKLIEISSTDHQPIEQITIANLNIQEAQEECLRIRRNTSNVYIVNNHISHCGLSISHFAGNQSNGEAIYIGSAPEKRTHTGKDFPHDIHIRSNHISGPIGECIDVKEDVVDVSIVNNTCVGAWEKNSGAINIRGSENLIVANMVINTQSSGIRLGGDNDKNAVDNIVVNNQLINNANGGIKIMNWPNLLCGNKSQQLRKIKDVRTRDKYSHSALESCHD